MYISHNFLEDKYYRLFEKYTIGNLLVCKLEPTLEIIYINKRFLKSLGCKLEDIIGKSYVDFVVDEDKQLIFEDISKHCENDAIYSIERRLQGIYGDKVYVMERGGIVILPDKQKVLKLILTDISKQKETEANLRISEKRYELAMNFSEVSMFDYDLLTRTMSVHYIDTDRYGVPHVMENVPDYMVDNGIIAPKSVDDFLELYQKIHNGEISANAKIWTFDINGEERLLDVQLYTIFDSEGQPTKAVGVHKDITAQVLLNKEREYNKALASKLLFAYEANISHDIVLDINKKWAKHERLNSDVSFAMLVEEMSNKMVALEHQQIFKEKLNAQTIIEEYQHGNNLFRISFVQDKAINKHIWYEKTINIVYDEVSGDYLIRCYIEDISATKEKEHRATAEQMYYDAMLAKSKFVYEVNVTKNLLIAGHTHWGAKFGIEVSSDYNKMLQVLSEVIVHPDEKNIFADTLSRVKLISDFQRGKRLVSCDYRLIDAERSWIWVRCAAHMFEDPEFGYIRGFFYVEEIDIEKKKELELLYKSQHDLLSGFYNKSTIKEKIDDYLLSAEGKYGEHALFMIDIDKFKNLNDTFGHVFGDVVISEMSAKIRSIFREMDLFGRVGGDEFVVFMKNVSKINLLMSKTKQLCELIQESYTKDNKTHNISISVGVSCYSRHGKDYDELYTAADIAMYNSKEYGRNRFTLYDESMKVCNIGRAQDAATALSRGRRFEDYISEYVLRILYEAKEPEVVINSVLELLGKHYNFCRAYIFEDSKDGCYTTNTFEWCEQGIEHIIRDFQNINYACIDHMRDKYNTEGVFVIPDISRVSGNLRNVLDGYNIKSMIAIALKYKGKIIGFMGFDSCKGSIVFEPEQIWDFVNIANIISMFIVQIRSREKYERANQFALSVLNGISSYIYVCDPKTYEVLFINKRLQEFVPQAKVGVPCYKAFCNYDQPCEMCVMRLLADSGQERAEREYYNTIFNTWLLEDSSWIDLIGYSRVCIINNIDITGYKK